MCNFSEIDGSSWIEHLIQIIFLFAGCSVSYFGLTLSVLLIGFLPIYFFAYLFYKKNLNLCDRKTLLFLVISCLIMLIFSSILWLSAAILGQWG
jgi:hypothetical protein